MDQTHAEQVVRLGLGTDLEVYAPVGPALCDACRSRADDVCFRVVHADGSTLDCGLCRSCLIALVQSVGRRAAARADT